MTIDLWRGDKELARISPDTPVWTMRLEAWLGDPFPSPGELCDLAWTVPTELERHFWYFGDRVVQVFKMSLVDYVRLHVAEVRGMNEFWDAGRDRSLEIWNRAHPDHPVLG